MAERPVIMVGIASRNNLLNGEMVTALHVNAQQANARFIPIISTLSPLHFARSQLVKRALSLPAFTHLWFVDDDVIPEPDCLKLLLDADEPIILGPYKMRTGFEMSDGRVDFPLAYGMFKGSVKLDTGMEVQRLRTKQISKEDAANSPVQQVDWVGMGCTLIRRDALETIPQSGFYLPPEEGQAVGVASAGEDIMYCISAAKKGVPVKVHVGALSDHTRLCRLPPQMTFHGDTYWDEEDLAKNSVTKMLAPEGGFPNECDVWISKKGAKLTHFTEARKRAKAAMKKEAEA